MRFATKLAGCFACLIFLIFLPIVFAQVPELNVHQFYGSVVNGVDGDAVKAVVNGNEFTTTVSNGGYGYSPTFNVEGGDAGDTIIFYINDVQVATFPYNPQGLTKLDLTKPSAAITTAPPTPPPPTVAPPTITTGGGRRRVQIPPRNATNVTNVTVQPCLESWVCNSWGACIGGSRARECFEESSCGTELLKPAVEESCQIAPVIVVPPVVQPVPPPPKPIPVEVRKEMPAEEGLNLLWIFILVFAILLVCGVIAVLIYFSFIKKGKSELRQFTRIDRLASLRIYVQKTRAMGYSGAQIRKALSSAGWKPADINAVLPVPKTATPVKTTASTRKV